jgi:peptidoglycan/xylan/chitin deacetylase (PgdA/CDA1 family)
MGRGTLVISLDFELLWGVRDHLTINDYGANILGARKAVPAMLSLFEAFRIHATWATVGMLLYGKREQMVADFPEEKPTYEHAPLSPYSDIHELGPDEVADPYRFGLSLIRSIAQCPNQEIGTHTFSHYYCCEPGQTAEQFAADLKAALRSAKHLGIELRSIVFPRNQTSAVYLQVCRELGLVCYRGNEKSWLYATGSYRGESKLKRAVRLADAYLNLTGHNTYQAMNENGLCNVRSSRFLRPYDRRLAPLDRIRLRRITSGIEHAAKNGEIYHLWWHPHNFGANLELNIAFLRSIFEHFDGMRERYRMQSLTMGEIAAGITSSHEQQACSQKA